MRCGIRDAELLQAHWDLQLAPWRKAVAAACQVLEEKLPPPNPAGFVKSQRSLKVCCPRKPCPHSKTLGPMHQHALSHPRCVWPVQTDGLGWWIFG